MDIKQLSYYCRPAGETTIPIENLRLILCKDVYEPSDDTWLTANMLKEVLDLNRYKVATCIDVGTGTGVLGLFCAIHKTYTVMIDISPCATACARQNIRYNKLDYIVDVIQCDNLSCIRRGLGENKIVITVYNLPYLPEEGKNGELLELSWSGGLNNVLRYIEEAERIKATNIIHTYSSLTGSIDNVTKEATKRRYKLYKVLKKHIFFEDIMVFAYCREQTA